jgi:coenzyme PQQ synthesis protein D (PqqD)
MTVLKLRDRAVAWTDVDGEIVALDEEAAVYLGANSAGALLWRALAHGATRESLAGMLSGEYGISLERAQGDTDAFLGALRDRALLDG